MTRRPTRAARIAADELVRVVDVGSQRGGVTIEEILAGHHNGKRAAAGHEEDMRERASRNGSEGMLNVVGQCSVIYPRLALGSRRRSIDRLWSYANVLTSLNPKVMMVKIAAMGDNVVDCYLARRDVSWRQLPERGS